MTVNADTQVYKGYTIEVDIDPVPGMNWRLQIKDSQGRLFSEVSLCNSKEAAFTVAWEIIDAEERMPGDIDYQPLSELRDHQG
ncbi:hypothetical protein ACEYW6_36755 [Nostoc sp. UIC 10607]|uniref:hypothetical protein n=1 Tax=Nostoc sp. UIC 10607 TaxID=3045935 RepID=UPI0039A04B85